MKIAVFDAKAYDKRALELANKQFGFTIEYFEERLHDKSVELAHYYDVVCPFVNCQVNETVMAKLEEFGIGLIALRAAGYNGIDLEAANKHNIKVARVPAYSPEAVAEHNFALLLTLIRKVHRAYNRVRDQNFSLDGLEGFTLHGKTYGAIGAGKIGQATIKIAKGFGCNVLAYDPFENPQVAKEVGFDYVSLETLLSKSDIISLHLPLSDLTKHIINQDTLKQTKKGVVIINTSRGGLINSQDLIDSLKIGQVGGVGLDVYELEEGVFFHDLSDQPLQDDKLARLMTFPNVLITSHQGFLAREALDSIANTTLGNVKAFSAGEKLVNEVHLNN
ncbi:2-hydroxyacid dehydrogenase [Thorsellia anophelis]|uniref:D-lactate dehydrogenase n=1 Tax=Thorsellia anophelis DSM 18579 TaxID=1123402 RepID=A0A1I0DES1_9GAMM|nr:2-hydroxyacid dehydrogenase [Thorsellia anophelis]SET30239.1 D-lactate dehydrogenase [Thorsellia anophelis DSM 18579]